MKLSDLARPPIQPHEIEGAETSTCVNHGGIVRFTGDTEGRVMWCPIGAEYWRYSRKHHLGMYGALPYRHGKPV